jgi:class 3 adenylate cyclase
VEYTGVMRSAKRQTWALQDVALPGEVVIAASTLRLVGQMFDCDALGAIEVKGQPIEAWRVRPRKLRGYR